MELINKATLLAEMKRRILEDYNTDDKEKDAVAQGAIASLKYYIEDTLEVKEVDIASMADDYYDALIKEAEMNVDMAGHCRLAYYTGCKDVLNKIQKGE